VPHARFSRLFTSVKKPLQKASNNTPFPVEIEGSLQFPVKSKILKIRRGIVGFQEIKREKFTTVLHAHTAGKPPHNQGMLHHPSISTEKDETAA